MSTPLKFMVLVVAVTHQVVLVDQAVGAAHIPQLPICRLLLEILFLMQLARQAQIIHLLLLEGIVGSMEPHLPDRLLAQRVVVAQQVGRAGRAVQPRLV